MPTRIRTASAWRSPPSKRGASTEALYEELLALDGDAVASEEEWKAKVAELLPQAQSQAAAEKSESYVALDFALVNGVWTVDEDSFENALDQVFGLW